MPTRAQLLEAHTHLTAAIRSAETWEKSYTDSPTTFRRLVRQEAALQASANEYLLGLRDRVMNMVNWSKVDLKPIQASAVPPESDDAWAAERALLAAALADYIHELMVIGANAGEELYSIPLGFTTLDEAILQAADRYTAELVKDITTTTRRFIQQSIKQSILQGEDVTKTIERIRNRVSNPVRAEMIARTESVNAYSRGLIHFGRQSGAESKTWECKLNACPVCIPLDGKTIPLDDLFTLGNGRQVSEPTGHVFCRCGIYLNYPK